MKHHLNNLLLLGKINHVQGMKHGWQIFLFLGEPHVKFSRKRVSLRLNLQSGEGSKWVAFPGNEGVKAKNIFSSHSSSRFSRHFSAIFSRHFFGDFDTKTRFFLFFRFFDFLFFVLLEQKEEEDETHFFLFRKTDLAKKFKKRKCVLSFRFRFAFPPKLRCVQCDQILPNFAT